MQNSLPSSCCCQQGPQGVDCTEYPALLLYRDTDGGLPQSGRPAWWQGIQTPSAKVVVAFHISGTKNGTPFELEFERTLTFQGGRSDQEQIPAPYPTYTAPLVSGPWSGGLEAEWGYCWRYRIPVFRSSASSTQCEYPYAIVLSPADPFACGSLVDLNACGFILQAPEISTLTSAVGQITFDDFFGDPEGGTWLSVNGDEVICYVPLKSLLPDKDWYEFEGDGSDSCCDGGGPFSEAVWRPGGDGFSIERDLDFTLTGDHWIVHLETTITTICWARPNYSRTTCGCKRSPTEFNERVLAFSGSIALRVADPDDGCDACQFTPSVPFSGTCTWSCTPPPENGVYFDATERYRGYRCLLDVGAMTWPTALQLCIPVVGETGPCEGCLSATIQGDPTSLTVDDIGVLPCRTPPGGSWPHSWSPNGFITIGATAAYDADDPGCLIGWTIIINDTFYFQWNDQSCDGRLNGIYVLYDRYGVEVGSISIG